MATKKVLEIRDFFDIPRKAFKFINFELFPENEIVTIYTRHQKVVRALKNVYFAFCMITYGVLPLMYIVWAILNSNEPLAFLRGLLNISNHVFALYRLITICLSRKKINKFLAMLNENFPTTKEDQRRHKISRYRDKIVRREKIYAVFCAMPTFIGALGNIGSFIKNGTEKFAIDIWLPLGHESTASYMFTCIFISWGSSLYSMALFLGDWVPYSLITVLAMEYDIVGRNLRKQLRNADMELSDLKKIVDHHNLLLQATNLLESLTQGLFFVNFIISSFTICLVGFQAIIFKDTPAIALYVAVLAVVMMETFLLCHHGQMLIDSRSRVCDMIYKSKWCDIKDLRVKKMLPMLLQISQDEKCLTGYGFFDICHETFRDVSMMYIF
jgi:hypothetical protein